MAATPVMANQLADAIAAVPQGTEPGQIDPSAPAGVFDIPGEPSPGLLLYFCWGVWVGLDFFNHRRGPCSYGRRGSYFHLRNGCLCQNI